MSGVLRLGSNTDRGALSAAADGTGFAGRCPDGAHLEIEEMITPQIVRAMEHDEIDAPPFLRAVPVGEYYPGLHLR